MSNGDTVWKRKAWTLLVTSIGEQVLFSSDEFYVNKETRPGDFITLGEESMTIYSR